MEYVSVEAYEQERARNKRLQEQLDAMRKMLLRLEWSDVAFQVSEQREQRCPECGNRKPSGHADHCDLAKALAMKE